MDPVTAEGVGEAEYASRQGGGCFEALLKNPKINPRALGKARTGFPRDKEEAWSRGNGGVVVSGGRDVCETPF